LSTCFVDLFCRLILSTYFVFLFRRITSSTYFVYLFRRITSSLTSSNYFFDVNVIAKRLLQPVHCTTCNLPQCMHEADPRFKFNVAFSVVRFFIDSMRHQRCQIFLVTKYQNGGKYNKLTRTLQNVHKI
jgi:hypothetical protein